MVRQIPLYLAGLALVAATIFDVGGQAYFALPMALTVIAMVLEWPKVAKAGWGNRWVLLLLGLMWLSSLVQVVWHQNFIGFAFMTWFCGLYFLGRGTEGKTLRVVAWGAILASVFVIVSKVTIWATGSFGFAEGRLWMVHHMAGFLILAGMALSRDWRLWLAGFPAVLLTGSEEGLIGLGLVCLVRIIESGAWNRILVPLGLCGCLVGVLVGTGLAGDLYPNLRVGRFDTLDSTLNLRVTPAQEAIESGAWIGGRGMEWDTMWGTIHNVPLKIASQFGIVAGLAWLCLVALGLRTRYWLLFLLFLWYGMIDHFLWGEAMVWSPIVLGIAQKEMEYGRT